MRADPWERVWQGSQRPERSEGETGHLRSLEVCVPWAGNVSGPEEIEEDEPCFIDNLFSLIIYIWLDGFSVSIFSSKKPFRINAPDQSSLMVKLFW